MTSMSKHTTTAEHLKKWRRWQPAPLPGGPTGDVGRLNGHAPCETPEPHLNDDASRSEANRVRETARQQGQAQGYQEGYAQGLEEGTRDGHRNGHSAGYDAGYTEGHSSGQALAQQEAQRLAHLADACADALHTLEAELGHQLVEFALHIAQHILQSTLTTQPGHITDLVGQILRVNANDQALLTLRIHPDDEAALRPYLESRSTVQRWCIVPDPTLERGDCIAETSASSIDATLAKRWERATSSLGYTLPWIAQADHAKS